MTANPLRLAVVALGLLVLNGPAGFISLAPISSPANAASNPFEIVVVVNDHAITQYEISQRALLLKAFGIEEDVEKRALKDLIDDRVRLSAAARVGLPVDEAAVDAGVSNLAAREDLTTEQLNAYVGRFGVDPETVRDFVRAAMSWERVVHAKYGDTARISEHEVDAALSLTSEESEQMVLLSEIILVADEQGMQRTEAIAWQLFEIIDDADEFAAAAIQFSKSPSRQDGGRLDWLSVRNIPPQVLTRVLAMKNGQVSGPIQIDDNVIGLFLLRGIRGGQPVERKPTTVSFLQIPVPSNWSADAASELIEGSETCADLQVAVLEFDPETDVAPKTKDDDTPELLAQAISRLDLGEAAFFGDESEDQSVIMVCRRSEQGSVESRNQIRNALYLQRLSGFGQSYLSRLRSEAFIEYK
ncbi:MAG: peptidylprolyl isomerase [Rhodobacteraceae bacterium]|nr:peptidylprolyl isomerase [Paracoccaceae bacterium]